jgi:hypothetical protein
VSLQPAGSPSIVITARVGIGKGGETRMKQHPGTFTAGVVFVVIGAIYLLEAFDVWAWTSPESGR